MRVVDLKENKREAIPGALGEFVGRALHEQDHGAFEVEAPSALVGPDWLVRSTGCVGYLPLGSEVALRIAPKVPIASLLAMLELAYDLPSLEWHGGLAAQSTVDGLFETLVMMLSRRVADRVRKGLYRTYVEEQDELIAVRGRILPRESIARAARGAVALVCEYETLTENLLDNQILLWTLDRARRAPLGRADVHRELRASHRMLTASLDLVPVRASDCVGRHYHQLNADYWAMHALCRLLLEACGSATESGKIESVPFTINMPRLFELFVARWLPTVLPALHVDAHCQLALGTDLGFDVDIVVRDGVGGRPLAVLDTKYKDHDLPKPDDVQQVVFYATVLGCTEACLVYPRPVHPIAVKAGPVTVRTFGLDLETLPRLDDMPVRRWAACVRGSEELGE